MRQLHPTPLPSVDPVATYGEAARPAPAGRPWVAMSMVSSVDGATAVEGRSGALGGAGDREVFHALRAVADVILVGAATVRSEGYGPPRPTARVRAARVGRGQAASPALAVVTATMQLDWDARLFREAEAPPIVVTVEGADPAPALAAGAEVVRAGSGGVSPERCLHELAGRGHVVVLLEGGPSLNGQFLAADLVDEVCLTVSPHLVGGDAKRVAVGGAPVLQDLELAHLLEHDGALFCRYVRAR